MDSRFEMRFCAVVEKFIWYYCCCLWRSGLWLDDGDLRKCVKCGSSNGFFFIFLNLSIRINRSVIIGNS